MSYRTGNDLNYYGSDLNKWIDQMTDHLKTCNNLDCVLFKRTKSRRREIESKHSKEGLKQTQVELMNERADEIRFLEERGYPIKIDLFVIYVDFDDKGLFGAVKIVDWVNGITKAINGNPKQLKDFLDFKVEFKDLVEDQREIEWE